MATTPIYALRYQATTDAPHGPNMGKNLAEDVEAQIARIDADTQIVRFGPNSKAVTNNIVTGTTTAAAYADMPATSSLSFTKRHASTKLAVDIHCGLYSTGANTVARIGVRVNAVDYDVTEITCNEVNEHLRGSGTADVASGLAAGTYTVQARWYRTTGAGTLTVGNDWFSMRVSEILSA